MVTEAQCVQGAQWIKFILPVFTTFLGAWFAFLWQNRRDTKRQEKANYGVLLKTQALFYEFFEVIFSIKKDFLDAYKDDKDRMLKVKHIGFCQKFSELNFEGLAFILATKSPDLFNDIVKAYRKCVSAVESIDERNRQYRKISGGNAKIEDLESGKVLLAMNPADLILLRDLTDIMYRETDQVLDRIKQIDGKLQQFIKGNFRGKHALKAILIEK